MAGIKQGYGNTPSRLPGTGLTIGAEAVIVHGTVDREGRLTDADPRLLALHRGAGGEDGGTLAVPQLASLSRLARSLGVLVSRGVIVADGAVDLELWVRAQTEGDTVRLSLGGWAEREATPPDPALAAARLADFARLEADGRWECDASLRLTSVDDGLRALALAPAGQPFARVFRLIEDAQGDLPLLPSLAARAGFAGQMAELRDAPEVRLTLHGTPKMDGDGSFAGYAGGYALADRAYLRAVSPPEAAAAPAPDFAAQLEGALRAPLTRIVANADEIGMYGEGPLRHDYAAYARDIASAGRHLIGLVGDLADVQAMEQSGFRIETELVDLGDIARKAAGLLAVRAADKRVKIDAPMADEMLEAQGDFRRVLQILVNLIGNAVRYSPQGAGIWVRAEIEGDLAAVIVADQGKGIAPADHERIFEKFERVDTSEPGGNGLGLYISRILARAMGGDITVDSAPGMGARFILTLPVG